MTTSTSTEPTQLPAPVRGFLAAHAARDVDAAISTFSPTAVVVDEGRTYRGTEEVLDFLRHAGAGFTYTTTFISAVRQDERHWVVRNRLEGDFPGGVVELDHRFTLAADLVAELVIAP